MATISGFVVVRNQAYRSDLTTTVSPNCGLTKRMPCKPMGDCKSGFFIAYYYHRKAGWNESLDVETRVTTAIALDSVIFGRTKQSMCFVIVSLRSTAQEAIDRITVSPRFDDTQRKKRYVSSKINFDEKPKHVNGGSLNLVSIISQTI